MEAQSSAVVPGQYFDASIPQFQLCEHRILEGFAQRHGICTSAGKGFGSRRSWACRIEVKFDAGSGPGIIHLRVSIPDFRRVARCFLAINPHDIQNPVGVPEHVTGTQTDHFIGDRVVIIELRLPNGRWSICSFRLCVVTDDDSNFHK